MLNTPPTFAIYILALVLEWLDSQGGLGTMARLNQAKASRLYAAIDSSEYYANPVTPSSRSWTNVPFTLADPSADAAFLAGAAERGLVNLKGHRSVGGMRASLYNAMPMTGVQALIDYMSEFEAAHG
jgi:phosphoserine aminotransferase